MEHIIEGIMELLSGLIKIPADTMPDIAYKDCFVIQYRRKAGVFSLVTSIVLILAISAAAVLMNNDARVFLILSDLCACFSLIYSIWMLTYKCVVNTETMTLTTLFVKRKVIHWRDILCVRVIESSNDSDLTIALYNREGNLELDVSSGIDQAWHLLKMAENKQIEIRKEKNLSIKQIKKL